MILNQIFWENGYKWLKSYLAIRLKRVESNGCSFDFKGIDGFTN